MYKAVFVDIDGTLVDDAKNVSEETMEAIKNAQEKGIQIVLCTGRQRIETREFKEKCGLSRYIICTNGAEIYDCENKETLFKATVDRNVAKKLYEFAIGNDVFAKFNFGIARAVTKLEFVEKNEIFLDDDIDEFLLKNEINQITLCAQEYEKIETAKKIIESTYQVRVVNEFIWEKENKKFHVIHCANSSVSKGNAMAGLCKYLGIDVKDVVAIGDDMNDISMIKMAGLGVAMGNALDEVKAVADVVTDSNEESGVGKILEKIAEGGI